jgi:hypothetical protein
MGVEAWGLEFHYDHYFVLDGSVYRMYYQGQYLGKFSVKSTKGAPWDYTQAGMTPQEEDMMVYPFLSYDPNGNRDLLNSIVTNGFNRPRGTTLDEAMAEDALGGGPMLGGGGALSMVGPLWTQTKNKTAVQNAWRHYVDHGADFGAQNAIDYVKKAKDFLNNPPPGTLTKVRVGGLKDGDVLRYHPATNTFGIMDKNGVPRTFYKPDPAVHGYPTNLDYFNAIQ